MAYFFQILEDTDEADMMGGACSLVIVEQNLFLAEERIDDDHILDDVILASGLTALGTVLDEVAESSFVSSLEPDDLRALFATAPGMFEERTLFPMD